MSCEQNIRCEEACYEAFLELTDDNFDLEGMLAYAFLESWDYYRVCKDGHYIWDHTTPDVVFGKLWEWDSEGMYYDMEGTIKKYYEEKSWGVNSLK
jgi:hypothetical protein